MDELALSRAPTDGAGIARAGAAIERDIAVRTAYARDASGLELIPEGVARPTTAGDVVGLMREAGASGTAITPAGGQTSTTGASITDRGLLVS
ncbi:MAG: FAD-binding protein, partial [Gemmatimonadota bacterium]|nr:FAD-binding protein [Gemmatimonadota bacterium]